MHLTDYWVDGEKIAAFSSGGASVQYLTDRGHEPRMVRLWTADDEAQRNARHRIEIKIDGLTDVEYEGLYDSIAALVHTATHRYEITGGTR